MQFITAKSPAEFHKRHSRLHSYPKNSQRPARGDRAPASIHPGRLCQPETWWPYEQQVLWSFPLSTWGNGGCTDHSYGVRSQNAGSKTRPSQFYSTASQSCQFYLGLACFERILTTLYDYSFIWLTWKWLIFTAILYMKPLTTLYNNYWVLIHTLL